MGPQAGMRLENRKLLCIGADAKQIRGAETKIPAGERLRAPPRTDPNAGTRPEEIFDTIGVFARRIRPKLSFVENSQTGITQETSRVGATA